MVWYAAVTRVNLARHAASSAAGFLSGCHRRHSRRYADFTTARSPLHDASSSSAAYASSIVRGPSGGVAAASSDDIAGRTAREGARPARLAG